MHRGAGYAARRFWPNPPLACLAACNNTREALHKGGEIAGTVTLTEHRSKYGIDLVGWPFTRHLLYCRHRFPAEVIAHAVWLYFRFPLSLRMVEDMLAARGVIVSHQTVRLWAEKFGRHFANDIRKRSAGKLGDKWHLDEVVITIGGKKHWLWRAVDQDGFVLDVRCKAVGMPGLQGV